MGRSFRPALALAAFGLVIGCGNAPPAQTGEVHFPPGKHVVRRAEVRVELVSVRYDDRGIDVHLRVDNRGPDPVTVQRRGITLAYDALEFPVATDPERVVAEQTEVPGEGTAELRARFDLGQRVTEDTKLRLRAVKRGAKWIEDVELVVPGSVDPTPPDRDAAP